MTLAPTPAPALAHVPLPPRSPGQETLTPDTGSAPAAARAQRFLLGAVGAVGAGATDAREVTPCG